MNITMVMSITSMVTGKIFVSATDFDGSDTLFSEYNEICSKLSCTNVGRVKVSATKLTNEFVISGHAISECVVAIHKEQHDIKRIIKEANRNDLLMYCM